MMSLVAAPMIGTVAAQEAETTYDEYGDVPESVTDPDSGYYAEETAVCQNAEGLIDSYLTSVNNDCWIIKQLPDSQQLASYQADNLETSAVQDAQDIANDEADIKERALGNAHRAFARSLANESNKAEARLAAEQAAVDTLVNEINNEIVQYNNEMINRAIGYDSTEGVSAYSTRPGSSSTNINYNGTFTATLKPWDDLNRTINITGVARLSENADNPAFVLTSSDISISQDTLQSHPALVDADIIYKRQMDTIEVSYDSSDYNSDSIDIKESQVSATYNNLTALRGEIINEIDAFSSSLNQSQWDDLDADDILGPTDWREWGQKYNQTGSSGYAAALASQAGYATAANLSTTYAVNLTSTDSVDYTGVIFGAPSAWNSTDGEIRTNHVYDGANQTAFVLPSGQTEKVALDEDYRVGNIELMDGTSVNSTQMQDLATDEYLNSSSFGANVEAYQELLNQTEELEDDGGGLPPLFGGDGPGAATIFGGVAVVISLILLIGAVARSG
jgi:hypothetical protein